MPRTLCKSFFIVSSILILLAALYLLSGGKLLNCSFIESIDKTSMLFISLTAFLIPVCFLVSWDKPLSYFALFFLLEFILFGFFSSNNLLFFYIFFELSLIPMFFIIGIWGSKNRVYAAYKFFLYTFVASIPFLCALIYIYVNDGNLNFEFLPQLVGGFGYKTKVLIWVALFIAFAVKIPMFPFHTWLPDAHVEAPTAGSILLAGVLIKLGGYGMIKILLPVLPDISFQFSSFVLALSVVAVIYASFVAWAQEDMKKMIAYSSIAHMGFVTAGIFSWSSIGVYGATFQMLSHGVVSAALFLCVGILYNRTHSRKIADYSGLASSMPIFSCCFLVFTMASIGLPGLSGFIGEFFSIVGLFKNFKMHAILISMGMLLGAIYMLSLCKKVIWGGGKMNICDVNAIEIFVLLILVLLTLFMGVFPNVFLNLMVFNIKFY